MYMVADSNGYFEAQRMLSFKSQGKKQKKTKNIYLLIIIFLK